MATYDQSASGGATSTFLTVIKVTNTGSEACRFGGWPTALGRSGAVTKKLSLSQVKATGRALTSIESGASGYVQIASGNDPGACNKKARGFSQLLLHFSSGQQLETAWPAPLSRTGCLQSITQLATLPQ